MNKTRFYSLRFLLLCLLLALLGCTVKKPVPDQANMPGALVCPKMHEGGIVNLIYYDKVKKRIVCSYSDSLHTTKPLIFKHYKPMHNYPDRLHVKGDPWGHTTVNGRAATFCISTRENCMFVPLKR